MQFTKPSVPQYKTLCQPAHDLQSLSLSVSFCTCRTGWTDLKENNLQIRHECVHCDFMSICMMHCVETTRQAFHSCFSAAVCLKQRTFLTITLSQRSCLVTSNNSQQRLVSPSDYMCPPSRLNLKAMKSCENNILFTFSCCLCKDLCPHWRTKPTNKTAKLLLSPVLVDKQQNWTLHLSSSEQQLIYVIMSISQFSCGRKKKKQ